MEEYTEQELLPLPKEINIRCMNVGKIDVWQWQLPNGEWSVEFRSLASLQGFFLRHHFGIVFNTTYPHWIDGKN